MAQTAAQAGYPADWVPYGNGGFMPPGMGAPQEAAPAPPGAPAAPSNPDPFASLGGGTPYGDGGWLPPGMPGTPQAPPAPGQTAPPPPAPAGPAAPAAPGAPPPGAPTTPQTVQQAFRDSINATLGGPSPDEYAAQAATGPEANAYKTTAQRSAERQQRQAAHLNAIQGGTANSPQLAMASRGIEQQRGESEAEFVANLTTQRLEAKRNEMMQAWQIAASLGDSAESRALQLQIAQMNAAIEQSRVGIEGQRANTERDLGFGQLDVDRSRVDTQRDLGFGDIDLRRQLGLGDLDLRRYGIDVGRDTALDELGLGYSNLSYQERRDRDERIARGAGG